MFDPTQPRARGLHSIAHVSINGRLQGVGAEHARLMWWFVLRPTKWPDKPEGPTWTANSTFAAQSGLDVRRVKLGIQKLREASMLVTPQGERPEGERWYGRTLVPQIDAPVKILVPSPEQMADLWWTCRTLRKRPVSLVTLMVGMHVLASHQLDRHQTDWAVVPGSLASLRRFVGAGRGSTFTDRFKVLEGHGLVRRRNGVISVTAPAWYI